MHREAFIYVQKQLAALNLDFPNADVVELGSYIVNGTVRPLFPETRSYVGVDVRAGSGVDVVEDASLYRPEQPVDLVVSTEMLEHSPKQSLVIKNIWRMLKPGGYLILTAAGVERVPHNNDGNHGMPTDEFYNNVSEADLSRWLKAAKFEDIDICCNQRAGDIYVTARRPLSTTATQPSLA